MGDVCRGRVLARGREIAMRGIPRHDVAACQGCHGANAVRQQLGFPRIAGQYPGYLEDQLRLFANEEGRGGGRFATAAADTHLTLPTS